MKIINGYITSKFGNRIHPVTGKQSAHNGIDIAAQLGTHIYSPCNGICIANYTHETGGKTIILYDKERNMRFGFCHLDVQHVTVGDIVCKGDPIARSGNTGRSTGAHLHFSAQVNGKLSGYTYSGGNWVDPTTYIEF